MRAAILRARIVRLEAELQEMRASAAPVSELQFARVIGRISAATLKLEGI